MNSKVAKGIRRFCLNCQGDYAPSVQQCADEACPLFSLRLCTVQPVPEHIRPLRAIRMYCIACAGTREEVRQCDAKESCPLWTFRFGVLPATFRRVVARQRERRQVLSLPGLNPDSFRKSF